MVDDGTSNPTDNVPFDDVLRGHLSRRTMIGGTLAVAAGFFAVAPASAHARASAGADATTSAATRRSARMDFTPVPLGFGDQVQVAAGWTALPVLPWGTPILPDAGDGTLPADAAQQARRVGLGHDGMWFFPTNSDGTRGLLCLNQEYGTNDHIRRGTGMTPGTAEFVALSQAVHGVTVVELAATTTGWQVVVGAKNRRITPNTPVTFSGPAASSAQLANPAANPFLGTLNNCANGKTPWGTYLTCEENVNGYFGATGPFTPTPEQARYGFSTGGFGYGWHVHDPRFDLSDPDHANEHNRFGWIVEIDPRRPNQAPVKRTALGRFKHENCEIVVGANDRVVAYMGDDERFEYVYKFVSSGNWRKMRQRGISPLDRGILYVARFGEDGTGTWIPLTMADPRLAERFADRADLLINARIAADIVGATPMDRPEWAAADPLGDAVFFTLTNNTSRKTPNPPNPRVPNPHGHIVRIDEVPGRRGTSFTWSIFVLSGPADDPSSTTDADSEHGSPDGLSFDADGLLYISTDGSQPQGANDQLLLADPASGEIKRFLTGVTGCEVTGWTPLGADAFIVNVQHPGDGDPAVSNWPSGVPGDVPRDACVIVSRTPG